MLRRQKLALATAVPVILLAVDRLFKWYAWTALPSGRSVVLFPGLEFGLLLNPGLVFSSFGPAVAVIASAAAFALLAILALRARTRFDEPITVIALWAFLLIALGGASNIYDRINSAGVIDYIIFARSAWNIADIMILAGLALILKRSPTGGKPDRSIKIDSGNTPHN